MENVTEIIHEEKDADIASKKGEEEFGGEIGEGKLQSPDEVMMDVILQDVTVSHLQLKQKPLTTFIGGGGFQHFRPPVCLRMQMLVFITSSPL